MLLLREKARTHVEIAAITCSTRSYVSTMLKPTEQAPDLVESMSRGGRSVGSLRALSAKEERRAQQLICGKGPDPLSMPFALWTRLVIRELILREFGIRLSIRGVGEYLARWGRTPSGQTPTVKIPARSKSLSSTAAVTNQGKVRFMIYPGGLSPEALIVLMQ